jgi:MFS family permease
MLLVAIVLAVLRDSPSFLLARGKREEAARAARRVLDADVELLAERHESADGRAIGVLHRSNKRFNLGIGIAFTASALSAYGILSWSTTFLTASGFTLEQAGNAVSVAGITSIAGSVAAGMLARRFGSRPVLAGIGAALVVMFGALGLAVEGLPDVPDAGERMLVVSLVGASAMMFSAAMASMYVIMIHGYPPSCRSAGVGFGIFMGRVGAISASAFGGALLQFGAGSVVPFFLVLMASAAMISAAAFFIDRHLPAAKGGV